MNNSDPVEEAIRAYGDAMAVMEPLRMRVWEERQLTVSQLRLTYLIRERGSPSLGDLAQALSITGATMSGLVDRLAKRGIVQRIQDETDRRVVRVKLTPEGERLSQELQHAGREFLRSVFVKLGPEVSAELADSLRQFGAAVAEVSADGTYDRLLHANESEKLPT